MAFPPSLLHAMPFATLMRWLCLCFTLYLCRGAKSHFHLGGQAHIGRPKIPQGSGSIEASLIIRYKDAIKARVRTRVSHKNGSKILVGVGGGLAIYTECI